MAQELLYLADPMCSWCWGFTPVLDRIRRELADGVTLRYVLGGLAEDSDDPMPAATQRMVQSAWGAVEKATRVRFNREFWTRCEPRRSTYPACRAVLAAEAEEPGSGPKMFRAIQEAYYLEARNPSDVDVLVAVATEKGFREEAFALRLASPEIEAQLQEHLREREHLGITANAAGFPTLILRTNEGDQALTRGYSPWDALEPVLARAGVIGRV